MFNPSEMEVHTFYQSLISRALKELLETKHLYQSVESSDAQFVESLTATDVGLQRYVVEMAATGASLEDAERARKRHNETVKELLLRCAETIGRGVWNLSVEPAHPFKPLTSPVGKTDNTYYLPSIQIPCANCAAVLPPHNSGYRTLTDGLKSQLLSSGKHVLQTFTLPYQCQACQGEPIVFLVRREAFKLTLVGRSHFEAPVIPKYIPKSVSGFYGRALISRNCNQVLAGLFYLRTLVEQHMRGVVNAKERLSGDELAERYGKTLPNEFNAGFPSLKSVYQNLSDALHQAAEDQDLFEREREEIEGHFEALALFKSRHRRHKNDLP